MYHNIAYKHRHFYIEVNNLWLALDHKMQKL